MTRRNPRTNAGPRPALAKTSKPAGEGATANGGEIADDEDGDRTIVELRTSRIRDANHRRIPRGRVVSMPTKRALDLADKGWVIDPPKNFDPAQVLELDD
jgi:hypothetical protein